MGVRLARRTSTAIISAAMNAVAANAAAYPAITPQFMLGMMADPNVDPSLRFKAAQAAAPFVHPRARPHLSTKPGQAHSAVVDADRWPDETVLLDLDRRAVCTKCGIIGADVRPSLTGAQWR